MVLSTMILGMFWYYSYKSSPGMTHLGLLFCCICGWWHWKFCCILLNTCLSFHL